MKLTQFDYCLPPELIAQTPASPRDHSRLLVYNRTLDQVTHDYFYNLPTWLKSGDVLVVNNTKVFPARLHGVKVTGGKLEIFLLKQKNNNIWQAMIGGAKRHVGDVVKINDKLNCKLLERENNGETWLVEFNLAGEMFWAQVELIGEAPLPPYIQQPSSREEYQTAYAKVRGSVAAPTAGFHLTKNLLEKLEQKGIRIVYVTLHVGLGTFAPVVAEDIANHVMHAEWGSIDEQTAEILNQAKQNGRRIIAVGTTSVRTLETFSNKQGFITAQDKWIDTFIFPGYEFKFVDAVITNFHLPKSTLLMLVAAFLAQNKKPLQGIEIMQWLYQVAIVGQYRFYSYGDGMLIV